MVHIYHTFWHRFKGRELDGDWERISDQLIFRWETVGQGTSLRGDQGRHPRDHYSLHVHHRHRLEYIIVNIVELGQLQYENVSYITEAYVQYEKIKAEYEKNNIRNTNRGIPEIHLQLSIDQKEIRPDNLEDWWLLFYTLLYI